VILDISGGPREGRGRFLVVIAFPGFGQKLAMSMPPIAIAKNVAKIEVLSGQSKISVYICGH
jgi:hypothetical protein